MEMFKKYGRIIPFLRFFIRRVLFLLATFWVFTIIIFLLPRVIPGNPLALLISRLFQKAQANPELIRDVERRLMNEFGIDKPYWEQFVNFIIRTFRGDLGTSIAFYPRKVTDLIFKYMPWTLGLLMPATIVSWSLGNLLGALTAYKRKTLIDNALLPIFLILSQTPYYWLAMLLLYVFSVKMAIFPVGDAYTIGRVPSLTLDFIADFLWHYTLPFLSITLSAIGGWAIGMRVLMIYELGSDHIEFSETLGLPDRKLIVYAFRNSMLPQITGLALNVGLMLGGSLITEVVFNYRGTGFLMLRALTLQDYPLIQGIFMILVSTLLFSILIVDIIYAFIDPRIRTGYLEE